MIIVYKIMHHRIRPGLTHTLARQTAGLGMDKQLYARETEECN